MQLNLAIKDQRLTLNYAELNDLLDGLKYAIQGGQTAKTFGAVTVSAAGKPEAPTDHLKTAY